MENGIYDVMVIEFQKGDESVGAISINKKDIDVMINLHGQTMETIVGDMVKTLHEALEKRQTDGVEE
jgi:hypothetical protein